MKDDMDYVGEKKSRCPLCGADLPEGTRGSKHCKKCAGLHERSKLLRQADEIIRRNRGKLPGEKNREKNPN